MRFLRPGRRHDEPPPVDSEAPPPATRAVPAWTTPDDDAAPGLGAGDEGEAADDGSRWPGESLESDLTVAPAPDPARIAPDVAEGDPDAAAADASSSDAAREAPPGSAGWPEGAEAIGEAGAARPGGVGGVEPAEPDAVLPEARLRPARVPLVLSSGSAGSDAGTDEGGEAGGRPSSLRFAALHLRAGQYALARAELEALAGRGRLDEDGLLDLAEVRWRTGDLAGAGDAANALLARGSESPLAFVIATEAVAAAGRPGEARRLSSRALAVADGPLDPLFAGMPRSTVWPATPEPEALPATPRRRGRNRAGDAGGAPSTASEAFAGGRAALARGDTTRAALLLGVAMRLAPEFAENVLHAVSGRDDQPLLALVRGDALRLLGREAEALEAFDRARGRANAPSSPSQPAAGPGLFDADPALGDDEGV